MQMFDDFPEFWAAYPRKIGKGQARKAYAKAVKMVPHDEIMFGLSQQRPGMESKEAQFVPHASTWLNGERWDDEPEEPTNDPRNSRTDALLRTLAIAGRERQTPTEDCF
jgi:hypothetical protein